MKDGGGKAKGATFERLVADLIRKAFKLTKKDVYRTPLSGGHPYADPADLVMSPAARRVFPFSVECKHRKTWKLTLDKETAEVRTWKQQATRAAQRSKLTPLLVIRGNATDIYCALPRIHAPAEMDCACVAMADGWVLLRFRDFLRLRLTRVKGALA
jgi:hypothetical protein